MKILESLTHMDEVCRHQWIRHKNELPPDQKRNAENDWQYFEKWTISLIQNATMIQADIQKQMNDLRHKNKDDPRDFDLELDSLESYFDRRSELDRSLHFFGKLSVPLQEALQTHLDELPITRKEMVDKATHYWNLFKRGIKRNNPDDNEEPIQNPRKYKGNRRPFASHKKFNKDKDKKSDKDSKPQRNPIGRDGKRNTCNICQSEWHYAPNCPKKGKKEESSHAKVQETRKTRKTEKEEESK